MEVCSEPCQEEHGLGQDEERDTSLAEQLHREGVMTLMERLVGDVASPGGKDKENQDEASR